MFRGWLYLRGNYMKHLKYLCYVLRHKWYVFIECCKLGIPVRGLVHDLSKFRPSEWFPYVNHFHNSNPRDKTGYYRPYDTGDRSFDNALFLHLKRNKHHWQWWVLPTDETGVKLLPMPDKYRKEMLADWRGASKAQGSKTTVREWYEANKHKLQLHPETRAWIEKHL